jgi:NADH-quinone oxidoreductase subunit L
MDAGNLIPTLLGLAVILPLVSFFAILIFGPKMGKAGENAGYVATAAIGSAGVLSFIALASWLYAHPPGASGDHAAAALPASQASALIVRGQEPTEEDPSEASHVEEAHADGEEDHSGHDDGHAEFKTPDNYSGEYSAPFFGGPWVLGQFGDLRLSISYFIDSLTVCMFCMVTFIATLIHIYAMGYMHEELHDVTDHEVTTSSGEHLHRPGRYHRFFQYLSLFCFSMLGLVVAGNIAMVFVFWELVGICSYFLIGFYVERKSASNAANKAFIVNRVGDFGMIIGLLALWTGLGTFSFGDIDLNENGVIDKNELGLFRQVRDAQESHDGHRIMAAPDGMVQLSAREEIAALMRDHEGMFDNAEESQQATSAEAAFRTDDWRKSGYGYGLLIVAGIGIFCGCIGKSAQFPLHTWLPDAMEGPTPVSALVHSATMVAAGVYLVGRFYPVFTPEVLLVIAVVGTITLFMAATIAITATDIKRVLAYSTVSQLGYMMMALGVGGWLAGVMHLITHAFFKSLLFMGSGSVIHAVHSNEMTEMGGLRKKMPVTAYTMLVGCLAIAGAGIPFMMWFDSPLAGLGFSGFYSKDAILEQAYSFMGSNGSGVGGVFFLAAAGGAAITAFYMFRMWYMTFAGKPRNQERFDHAHESPPTMYAPLIILAVMAIGVAWSPLQGVVGGMLATIVFAAWRFSRKGKQEAAHAEHDSDQHHDHSALPSWLGDLPLVLSVFVLLIGVAWTIGGFGHVTLRGLLGQADPVGDHFGADAVWLAGWTWPAQHAAHEPHILIPVSIIAIGTAFAGFLLATMMYGLGYLNPAEVRAQFQSVYNFLLNKWWFDELYDWLFVRPTHVVSRCIAGFDRNWIDRFIDGLASTTAAFSTFWAWLADTVIVDGFVDTLAAWTHSIGLSLRAVQTGRIRQYVMFIVVGAVAIFILISIFWTPTLAG